MTNPTAIVCILISLLCIGCDPSKEQTEERRFRAWVDSDFQKLIASVERALERIEKEGWKEGTVPAELIYLNPDRVLVGERGMTIETFISLDSSTGLSVYLEDDGEWVVSLFVNEHGGPEEIWKGSGYTN